MNARPKALLFDLGNVCLPFDHGRMIHQTAVLFDTTPDEVSGVVFGGDTFVEIERGGISDDELRSMLCRKFGRDVSRDELLQAVGDIFTPDESMNDLLAELRGTGIPMILVSNTNALHADFVRQNLDILDNFDELILSYAVKAAKPEAAFYEAAFAVAGCSPGECFYTDDVIEYVEAGRALGIDSEQFVGSSELRRQLEIRGVL